jgi:hypothetical protein
MKKILLTVSLIILFVGFNSAEASANTRFGFNLSKLNSAVSFENAMKSINSNRLTVKSGTYNESEDPLFRRGTQNTDSPQSMFFIIPVALTLIFFIVLLLRKK